MNDKKKLDTNKMYACQDISCKPSCVMMIYASLGKPSKKKFLAEVSVKGGDVNIFDFGFKKTSICNIIFFWTANFFSSTLAVL